MEIKEKDLTPSVQFPNRAPEVTIDGLPAGNFLAQEKTARERGATLMFNDDGTPYDPRDTGVKRVHPYRSEAEPSGGSFYAPEPRPVKDKSTALDTAFLEDLIVERSTTSMEQRVSDNMQGNGAFDVDEPRTPENIIVTMLKRQAESDLINTYIGIESIDELEGDELYERLEFAVKFADIRDMTKQEIISVQMLDMGHRGIDVAQIDNKITFAETEAIRNSIKSEQLTLVRNIVNEFVADQGWETWYDATADVAIQEMVPIYNVLSKVGFQEVFMEELKIGEEGAKFFLGERRQDIREALIAMNPSERAAAVRNIVDEVRKLQGDPEMAPLLRTFNVLENFEAIFTEDLLDDKTASNSFDRFFGNFESAAESLFSVVAIGRLGGKGLRGVFRTVDSNKMAKAARVAGDRKTQLKAKATLEQAASDLLANQDELAAARLARPEEFVDERTIDLPGIRNLSERLDRYEDEILKGQAGRLSRALSTEEKQLAVDKTLATIELGDSAVISPSMSTVRETADGAYIQAVIAKNGNEGWNGVQDLLTDLVDLDPTLESLKIMRRNKDGVLEEVQLTAEEFAAIVTRDVTIMTDAQIISASTKTKSALEFDILEREAAKRAGRPRTANDLLDDEYFLQYNHDRVWHPTDKVVFGGKSMRNTSTILPRIALTPNAKFGDEIVGTFQDNYLSGAREKRLFEGMYKPYYQLSTKDKRAVQHAYEWGEDFGKQNGVAPTLYDYYGEFPDLTTKQMEGLVALRRGFDTQYEVFNRRMFLDFSGAGYNTARSVDPQLPRFHGRVERIEDAKGGTYYDPVTQSERQLTRAEVEQVYNDGGAIMYLDQAIDVPGSGGKAKSSQLVLDGSGYKVGQLSTKPLEYYPNYSFRFYDDPYYIVKRTNGVSVNGKVGGAASRTEEAIKTTGSQLEGEAFLGRIGTRTVDQAGKVSWKDADGFEYDIVPARQLDQGDSVLYQKQTLHREGRLFWDKRSQDRLLNTNGERAGLVDFTQSLERGTQLAARLNSEEDAIKALKHGFETDFAKVADLSPGDLALKDMSTVIDDLNVKLRAASAPETRARLQKAIEIAKYIRQMEGVESKTVPIIRSAILRTAVWVERLTGGRLGGKAAQKFAQGVDPIKATRNVAFHTFMVYRPVRQLLLQMSQPLFLVGIDPIYVASGKGFTDSIALRMGFGRYVNSAFDPGYSNKALAKAMGLTNKEFTILVREFEKSGAVDVVDTHAFAGGSSTFHKQALPQGGIASKAWYGTKRVVGGFNEIMRKGFDYGEGFNKIGSYNVAWRRVMKQKGYKSLTEMTKKDWAQVKIDTDNLSLAMSRPNNAAYQSGLLSVSTQFLSFTHKVALAMMGKNPALKGKDVRKLWAGMLIMFGANMFGARDWTREQMIGLGLDEYIDEVLPDHPALPSGTTVLDLLSAGLVQTMVNKVGTWTDDDWKAIDTENFTPVLNVKQFYEMSLEGLLTLDPKVLFGPFGNRASAGMRAYAFASNVASGLEMGPADKFTMIAKHLLAETLPQVGDITKALISYEMGKLYHMSGESLALEPTMTQLVLKGVLGATTMEEQAYYSLDEKLHSSDDQVRELSRDIRRFLKQYHFLYEKGDISADQWLEIAAIAGELAGMAPDGRKMEVIESAMLDSLSDDDPTKSMVSLLAEGAINQKLTEAEIKDMMNQLPIPDEVKNSLNQMIEGGLLDETQMNQEEMRQQLIENNPNLRD